MKFFYKAFILLIVSSVYPLNSHAEESSNLEITTINTNIIAQLRQPTNPPLPNEIPDFSPREENNPNLEIPSNPQPPSPETTNFSGTIRVTEFKLKGITKKVFKDSKLEEVLEDFIEKEITFAQLLEVEQRIRQLYFDAGFINSDAVIPANQALNPNDAIVEIQIIEGEIKDIEISGTNRLNSSYIRNRLAIASKKPFNSNKLLQALQLLQLNPLIENISAELSAGVNPQASLLTVEVTEAQTFSILPFADNGRTPSVGSLKG